MEIVSHQEAIPKVQPIQDIKQLFQEDEEEPLDDDEGQSEDE